MILDVIGTKNNFFKNEHSKTNFTYSRNSKSIYSTCKTLHCFYRLLLSSCSSQFVVLVGFFMNYHVVAFGKRFAAQITFERLFPCMGPGV